jgi:hypothetical protein
MAERHNERTREIAESFGGPLTDVHADLPGFEEPEQLGGREPDVEVETPFGETFIEVDSSRNSRDNEQFQEMQTATGPNEDLECVVFGDEQEDSGFGGLFF